MYACSSEPQISIQEMVNELKHGLSFLDVFQRSLTRLTAGKCAAKFLASVLSQSEYFHIDIFNAFPGKRKKAVRNCTALVITLTGISLLGILFSARDTISLLPQLSSTGMRAVLFSIRGLL